MYDPIIGRWLEEDPTGLDAGDMNLYRMEGNNPTSYVDPTGLQKTSAVQRIGGKRVKLKDSTFKFGTGEATVSIWIDATIFNPKNKKKLSELIYMQIQSTKNSVKDVHFLQFAYRYQRIDKNTLGKFIDNISKPGGRTVRCHDMERHVDSGSDKDAYYDTTSRLTIRSETGVAIVDRPGMYEEKNTIEDGVIFDTYIIASGKVVYHISWRRVSTFDGKNWTAQYTVEGEKADRLPDWARGNKLLWGYKTIVDVEKLELKDPIYIENPVPKDNR